MRIIQIENVLPIEKSNGRRKLDEIVYAVVHHDTDRSDLEYDPIARYVSHARYHISKGWGRISYHFRIDKFGNVYQTAPLEEIAYHAGNIKLVRNSVGICVDGNFDLHDPTLAQFRSLRRLLDHLCSERPDIPKLVRSTVRCHSEVRERPTDCPGSRLSVMVKGYAKGS